MESRDSLPLSDLEDARALQERNENAAQHVLDQLGIMLSTADHALDDLQQEDVLGSAIVRSCRDLADMIGQLATQIEDQSDDERRAMAKACLEDAQQNLLLQEEGMVGITTYADVASMNDENTDSSAQLQEFSQLSEDDMMNALSAAKSLLRDVEYTLRAIDQDEADEIADVALTVARLFIASMQSIQSKLTPEDLTAPMSRSDTTSRSLEIELIEEEDEGEDKKSDSPLKNTSKTNKQKKNREDHLRVLWPPLGPAVASACNWGKEAAANQPLLAVALGLTLWPAAVVTTVVGAPLVLADGFVQDFYRNFQDGPVIQGLERGAAQLYQTGRLSLLCGKLVGRQTLRVVSRQVKRHGGVGKIAQDLGGLAVERATHPVETIGMTWNGIAWGVGKIQEVVEQVTDQEREEAAQELQQ